jgi:hypothetical protein
MASVRMSGAMLARWAVVAGAVLLMATSASAGIVVFSAQDDGAPVGGPFPSSAAAEASFKAAAAGLGTINTITFEGVPLGFNTPFSPTTGVDVSIAAPNFGDGFSGVSTTTFGNLYGFNVTPGGAEWLGSPGGSSTFSFTTGTQSFGLWLTGVQTVFTSTFTLSFNDGTSQVLNIPVNVNGGAQYFGFTDAGKSILAVTITNDSNDAWGIDDVTYNTGTVPEPSSMILLGSGIVGLVRARRKRS